MLTQGGCRRATARLTSRGPSAATITRWNPSHKPKCAAWSRRAILLAFRPAYNLLFRQASAPESTSTLDAAPSRIDAGIAHIVCGVVAAVSSWDAGISTFPRDAA